MDRQKQNQKARQFLKLHHDAKLLVLPNIWDPLGARMLESLGYPAVATASAAVAFSLGYDDGERITFDAMLDVIGRIASAVDVPVTADVERGYGDAPEAVADNMRKVLHTGVVGINLEDGTMESGPLRPIDAQCARIRAVRKMAEAEGVALVINARTDVFLGGDSGTRSERIAETIARARAYLDAGADCIYPITVGDIDTLKIIHAESNALLNVYASPSAASMRELESAGIARLSLGPGLIKASLTTMKNVARELLNYAPYDSFTKEAISSEELRALVSHEPMP